MITSVVRVSSTPPFCPPVATAPRASSADAPLDRPLRSVAVSRPLDGAFASCREGRVVALRGSREVDASIADFIRDNQATLSRCTTSTAVTSLVISKADTELRARWLGCATTWDTASIRRMTRAAAVASRLRSGAIDAVVDGIANGMAQIVVDETVRRPLQRAYVEALTERNASLEEIDDPSATAIMRDNDRLIHELSAGQSHSDIGQVDVAFTRAHIATASIGLDANDFPFSSANADTLARSAVIAAARAGAAPSAHDRELLESAVVAVRNAEPDELELLPAE